MPNNLLRHNDQLGPVHPAEYDAGYSSAATCGSTQRLDTAGGGRSGLDYQLSTGSAPDLSAVTFVTISASSLNNQRACPDGHANQISVTDEEPV